MHQFGAERAMKRLEERNSSFHEILLACIRFYAENENFLRSSFGAGVANPYSRLSLESSSSLIRAYICRRGGLTTLPEKLEIFVQMFVFSCMCAFSEYGTHKLDLSVEDLAVCIEQGMPEPLKPYLLN